MRNDASLNYLENESAVQVINRILSLAVEEDASDIHCDPLDDSILIRFRVDGNMQEVGRIPRHILEEMVSRLKILSGARTDLHSVPQDGRWRAEIGGHEFNIRSSFMPTYHGENFVLRLLPVKGKLSYSWQELGFSPDHACCLERVLQCSHGLILVTGPTGSGKTTTLHAALVKKSKEPLSIITLEDPVEYEIPGVRQVHIRHNQGVTFASGLRSALRQDPDVIMVGEIRDSETAKVAVHTALTGHLVLSTLHTNSALEAIPRLVDMGIDSYLLASTLKLVIAQRLVRTVCKVCSGNGCPNCRNGYCGRSIIAEVLEIDKNLKSMFATDIPMADCIDYARSHGFRPIQEDGSEKIQWGITTREEVGRALYS